MESESVTTLPPWPPSLVSWFLAKKSEEGNKATFSHWPKLDTLFSNPGMNFAAALAGGQRFCELIKYNRKAPLWKIPGIFWTIPVKDSK